MRGSSFLAPHSQRGTLNKFQGASAVGGGVKELKDRVRNLMTIIIIHVKSQIHVESNKMTIANVMKRMEGDSGELLRFVSSLNLV